MEGSEYYYSMVQWSIMWLLVLIVVSCLFFFFFWESRVCWKPGWKTEEIENWKDVDIMAILFKDVHTQNTGNCTLYDCRNAQCPILVAKLLFFHIQLDKWHTFPLSPPPPHPSFRLPSKSTAWMVAVEPCHQHRARWCHQTNPKQAAKFVRR